jgi:hypothetical protein
LEFQLSEPARNTANHEAVSITRTSRAFATSCACSSRTCGSCRDPLPRSALRTDNLKRVGGIETDGQVEKERIERKGTWSEIFAPANTTREQLRTHFAGLPVVHHHVHAHKSDSHTQGPELRDHHALAQLSRAPQGGTCSAPSSLPFDSRQQLRNTPVSALAKRRGDIRGLRPALFQCWQHSQYLQCCELSSHRIFNFILPRCVPRLCLLSQLFLDG